MKLSIIVLITINTLTSVAFGQTRYIKTIEGSIVDTSTYAKLKAEKVEKIKSIMQTKDIKIAIKVIETVNLNEKQRYPNKKRNMINNEIDILQSVSHTNVVRVFEILLSEKQIFVIMEYCD